MPENILRKQLQKLPVFWKKHVDASTAWKAALFLGVVVFCINLEHGALAALTAALKQASYTFLVAGFIVRLCEKLVTQEPDPLIAYTLAIVLPSCIAISLTFLLHSLKGTPLPFHSTLPTIVMAPPSFAIWAWRSRKNISLEKTNA